MEAEEEEEETSLPPRTIHDRSAALDAKSRTPPPTRARSMAPSQQRAEAAAAATGAIPRTRRTVEE